MSTPAPTPLLPPDTPDALPVHLAGEADYAAWLDSRPARERAWLDALRFRPERGRVAVLAGEDGRPAGAVAGTGPVAPPDCEPWIGAQVAERLPAGTWRLATALDEPAATRFALAWRLGQYRYARYRNASASAPVAALVAPTGADAAHYVEACVEAISLARDLINTPPNDLGPAELAAAAAEVAARTGGACEVIADESLAGGYPLIHAVGRGSDRPPRLIRLDWPREGARRVVIVGKGVCFDTGGLDLKPPAGMLLMKKDMGGAACALGLALLLRRTGVNVSLRVLIPAVENAVDGRSYRPGDVVRSRRGLTVEIGNTDAEGRLVLADALHDAFEGQPDLVIDLATLTGAARVALGPDLPALFSGDDGLARAAVESGARLADPLWQLPLWDGYDDELSSRVADLNNVSTSGFSGAILGALFLRRFVADPRRWMHVDLYAWNAKDRPGRPLGGEGQAIRALHDLIRQRFG
jgi:leucyl aminopeptidase